MTGHPGVLTRTERPPARPEITRANDFLFSAPRFEEGPALATVADRLGLQNVSRTIYKALRSDRESSTFACYSAELRKFLSWKGSDALPAIPLEKAALNYFCGPLTGVDLDIQQSILEAERRSSPETTHRTKIDQQSMRRLVLEGLDSADYKVTQAAALAFLQSKVFLIISEAQALRSVDLTFVGGGYYRLKIRKSKTDQHGKGAVIKFHLDKVEMALLRKYLGQCTGAVHIFQSRSTGRPLSSATLRDRLNCFLGGEAASLALSLGAEQTAVMMAGRWKTINAFRYYVAPKAIPLPTDPTFSGALNLAQNRPELMY
ncbi:unnamed protein product [Cylicocyclus nassatus]|uniref:Uncharacterized protein n=1 Tax=Cylicocyclus nassatus TaxID=53992 RepID=A0AA36DLL8_CYLNA|nr:unnamed protein product [Cylicocyclus nassatus]